MLQGWRGGLVFSTQKFEGTNMKKSKNNQMKVTVGLLIVYAVVLAWGILFKMQFPLRYLHNLRGLNLIPFARSVIINNKLDYSEIILNMIAFIPLGLYVSMIKPGWAVWSRIMVAAGVSLLFETLQFLFAIGITDITDVISNTLGGVVGIGIYAAFSKLLKEKTPKVLNVIALIGTMGMVLLLGVLVYNSQTN